MKILIVEDDTATRMVLAATLRQLGHEVIAVADGVAALEAWRKDAYPLVISDWMMPELDGPGLCRAIRAERRQHYTYVLLLTSLEGKGNYLAGMDAGADDFISKPLDEELLMARLKVAERILSLHDALRIQATRDRLTGVLNRGAILDLLEEELHRVARGSGAIGVLLIDIDNFKMVNDTHGHLVGDSVLREVSQRMLSALRPYDRLGRFGGEEFIVLVPDSDAVQSAVIAERLRQVVAGLPFAVDGDASIPVTISIGVAVEATGAAPGDAARLLGAADRALYRAKGNGRNRVESEAVGLDAPSPLTCA